MLYRGKICPNDTCPKCGLEGEDTEHVFFRCTYSKAIYGHMLTQIITTPAPNEKDTVFFFLAKSSVEVQKILQ